jgi:radical SAM superfamily enzyme YgiQ (UPF0313 family)
MNEKVLFLHVSKNIEKNNKILIMPIGIIALSNYVNKKYSSRVMHLDLEKAIDSKFNLIAFIKQRGIKIICLDLHWHHQSYNVIHIARTIKENFPEIKIILGGFTASFFNKEIMENFLFIDYIIRGDGEDAIFELISAIYGKIPFDKVSNLSWRKNGEVICNEIVVRPESIEKLDYADFSLLYHSDKYCFREFLYQNFNIDEIPLLDNSPKIFFFNCGRGCLVNCTYCGGSNISQKLINNRGCLIKMSINSAIRNLSKANRAGYNWWWTDFYPGGMEEYYLELFERLRKEKISLRVTFGLWYLPSMDFLESFKKTFSSDSEIEISPDTGSERVRRMNKGYYYTNQDFFMVLDMLKKIGIKFSVHFGVGFSNEKIEDIEKTKQFIKKIRETYPEVEIIVSGIESEPGSPIYLNPDKFGIINERKCFMDFYESHKGITDIGYETKHLSKEKILSALEEMKILAKK